MLNQIYKSSFIDNYNSKSLYIHWPFCPYKCTFCPFVAFAGRDCLMGSYHQALKKELLFFADQKRTLDTIYLGGGTPSTYPEKEILDMFDTIRRVCILNQDAEITIEVNPGTVSKEKILVWKEIGINRLSIGIQALDNEVLAKLNRHQTIEQVENLLDEVCDIFNSVSIDLIVGLPGVSFSSWQNTIKKLLTWDIKHLSMYFLTVHQGTPLYTGIQQKKVDLPADDEVVKHYEWACKYLKQSGFEQYEVSSFAKNGYKAKHNSMYWQRKPFKGIGVGAFSFDGNRRIQNCKSIIKYLDSFELDDIDIQEYCEELKPEQVWLEKLMLGIRCSDGADIAEVLEPLTVESCKEFTDFIFNCRLKNLFIADEKLILSYKGAAVENEILERMARIVVLKNN